MRPEISHQASLGIELKHSGSCFRRSLLYNRLTDSVQGAPIARLDAAGLRVLQYRNFAAELYGVDGDWRWQIGSSFAPGGTLSCVGGDVAVGDPIPGACRFPYVNATLYW